MGSGNGQGEPLLIGPGESPYCSEIEGWGTSQCTFSVGSQWFVFDAYMSHLCTCLAWW
jgi:hypothetical protein